jgi:hypothetical protein
MRLALLLAVLVGSTGSSLSASADEILDQGNLIVKLNDRVLNVETFKILVLGDSLVLEAQIYGQQPTPDGDRPIEKEMVLVAGRDDYELRSYQSTMTFQGHKLLRGIVMGDTSMTLYREGTRSGIGEGIPRPPGRFFVLDARLFSLFDLICLSLHEKTFETRPLSLLALGARDSVLEATVTRLGVETVRWGARPVQARKLKITDGVTTYLLWTNPAGRLLRLEHQESLTRVEREPPPVKGRSPSKPGG